ncbi:Protein quiver, partial [Fragariocoptes setiger]
MPIATISFDGRQTRADEYHITATTTACQILQQSNLSITGKLTSQALQTNFTVRTVSKLLLIVSKVWCFECDSKLDPRCNDPFNYTTATIPANERMIDKLIDRSHALQCHGCCVKITSISQGVRYVKRTCTSNLQINYFMVDHVCMRESGSRGTMCFCGSIQD